MSPLLSPDHCVLDDWQPLSPPDFQKLSPAAVLARCRRGDGPRYEKILGERSQPIWLRSNVTIFFKQTFQIHYPEAVQSLLDANFPDVPVTSKKKKKGKAKPKPKAKTVRGRKKKKVASDVRGQ